MATEFPLPLSGAETGAPRRPSLAAAPSAEPSTFSRAFAAIGAEVDRGERLIDGVLSRRAAHLSASDLIALQAGIYRYTEVVDLTAKLVDRAAAAVRTTLQSSG